MNWAGRLLRDADAQPDLLGALIQATKDGDQSRFQALAGLEKQVDQSPKELFNESESESESESEQEIEVIYSVHQIPNSRVALVKSKVSDFFGDYQIEMLWDRVIESSLLHEHTSFLN